MIYKYAALCMLIQMIGFIKLIEAKKLIAVNCYESTNLAPLRSAIGMMEQWNDGIMGSGILEWWI
jgi:hypothetical protein